MRPDTELTVVLVYPELLGTYGDRGNALALVRRAQLRNVPVRILKVPLGRPLPAGDIYLLGGGEDAAEVLALRSLSGQRQARAVLGEASACLAVCAGLQILAREFETADGRREAGLGLLDVSCGRLPGRRAVGEVLVDPTGIADLPMLTGYENHQGDAVVMADAQPLGRVVQGVGNGVARLDGAVQGHIVGTYLHGPVLVRNPALADRLIEWAAGPLLPVCDEAVERLRAERLAACRGKWLSVRRVALLGG
ncbi:MAG: glutamine amidotransferase [Nocardioidaceae bacterium]